MKGALAAMMLAAERFVTDHPDFKGRLGFLITSDEEAKATHGTKLAIQALKDRELPSILPLSANLQAAKCSATPSEWDAGDHLTAH